MANGRGHGPLLLLLCANIYPARPLTLVCTTEVQPRLVNTRVNQMLWMIVSVALTLF